jgi:type VI secretion system secreted protein Hcp
MTDYFLKIDGIAGDSQDSEHRGEIELESFSWGESHPRTPGDTPIRGQGPGRVQIEDLRVTMRMGRAAPGFMLAAASGQHLKTAWLTGRLAGKEQQEFLKVTLSDLLVSSYRTEAVPEQPYPVDRVSFNFAQIEIEYRPQKPDGTLDVPVTAGWDVSKSQPV